jgi:hypothetical protein
MDAKAAAILQKLSANLLAASSLRWVSDINPRMQGLLMHAPWQHCCEDHHAHERAWKDLYAAVPAILGAS